MFSVYYDVFCLLWYFLFPCLTLGPRHIPHFDRNNSARVWSVLIHRRRGDGYGGELDNWSGNLMVVVCKINSFLFFFSWKSAAAATHVLIQGDEIDRSCLPASSGQEFAIPLGVGCLGNCWISNEPILKSIIIGMFCVSNRMEWGFGYRATIVQKKWEIRGRGSGPVCFHKRTTLWVCPTTTWWWDTLTKISVGTEKIKTLLCSICFHVFSHGVPNNDLIVKLLPDQMASSVWSPRHYPVRMTSRPQETSRGQVITALN